jgi:hypothetical protein
MGARRRFGGRLIAPVLARQQTVSADCYFYFFSNFSDAEFMQYRNPVGFGPSSNT